MAVYTHLEKAEIDAFMAQFDLGKVDDCHAIEAGITNSNYLIRTNLGQFKLTIYERYANRQDLLFYIGALDHLNTHKLLVPVPLADRKQNFIFTLHEKPALLFPYIDGQEITADICDENLLRLAGTTLAKLHQAGIDCDYKRSNPTGYNYFDHSIEILGQIDLPEKQKPRFQTINKYWQTHKSDFADLFKELPLGLIHGDYFIDNILRFPTRSDRLIILDFDYACFDMPAYDLAIALNAWCFHQKGDSINHDFLQAFMQGYQSTRPLQENEKSALYFLCQMAALRFTLSRMRDKFSKENNMHSGTPHPVTPYWNRFQFWQNPINTNLFLTLGST